MVVQSSSRLPTSTASQAPTTKVLRFRKLVTKFVSDNHSDYHKKLGLSMEIGPIFSWADNYDLHIATPNGTKNIHVMIMEFTQQPACIIETGNIGVMQLKIPRPTKHEASSLRLTQQAVQIEHYSRPSKLTPPLPTKAVSAEESQFQFTVVKFISNEMRRGCRKSTRPKSRSSGRVSTFSKTDW